jgi:DNA-binding response OmpR family regulator
MLVEDNEDHAILIRKSMQAECKENTLEIFVDAESALEYLKAKELGKSYIVILDINLPGMHGLELLREIKSDHKLRGIPVIMLSTSDSETDRAKAYEYSANSYLTKPVDFEKFCQMIKDLSFYWGVWNRPEK